MRSGIRKSIRSCLHSSRAVLVLVVAAGLAGASCAQVHKLLHGSNNPAVPQGASQVDVVLDEYTITMPDRIPVGRVAFVIRNKGFHEHAFQITGQGMDEGLDSTLTTGQMKVLTVTMTAGQYVVTSPARDDAELGMRKVVTAG